MISEDSFIEWILDNNKDILGLNSNDISNKLETQQLSGGSNINYKLTIKNKSFFFKYNQQDMKPIYYKNNLEREYEVSNFLHDKFGIAPKPYFFDKKNKVIISEFIKGKAPQSTDVNFSTTLYLIGNAFNLWHDFPVPILKRLYTGTRICPKNYFQKIILPTTTSMAKNLLQEGSPALFQFLEDLSGILTDRLRYEPKSDCQVDWKLYEENPYNFPGGLIHNDFALRNIIITENSKRPICFIDWEYADFGDISFDLAYLQSENMLLSQQLDVITSFGNLSEYIKERSARYIKVFLPMLELANAYWAVNHIAKMIDNPSESDVKKKKIKLRPPYSIVENLSFIRTKINRLVRLSRLNGEIDYEKENELFIEMQYALKIFESQLIVE